MRACEGCRRRKIKCDAATTNTWPCSACVRLKLHCVPPMMQYDREFASQGVLDQPTGGGEYRDDSSGSGEDEYSHQQAQVGQRKRITVPAGPAYVHHRASSDYRQISPPEQSPPASNGIQYSHLPHQTSAADTLETMSSLQQFHNVSAYSPHSSVRHNDQWAAEDSYTAAAASVSGVLEQLKIDDSGVGEFLNGWISDALTGHC